MKFENILEIMDHNELVDFIDKDGINSYLHVPRPAFAYWVSSLTKQVNRNCVIITNNQERAEDLYNNLLEWCGDFAKIYLLPENEFLPFEYQMNSHLSTHKRIECLSALSINSSNETSLLPAVVVASVSSATQKTLGMNELKSSVINLTLNQSIDISTFMHKCLSIGYENHFTVETPGSIAKRGGIIDVFSPTMDRPVRIEFLGNTIESMRVFDIQTQRSQETIDNYIILPAQELIPQFIDKSDVEEFCATIDMSNCLPEIQERITQDLTSITAGYSVQSNVIYNGVFCKNTIFDYLSNNAILLIEQMDDVTEESRKLDEHENRTKLNKELAGLIPTNFPSGRISSNEFETCVNETSVKLKIYNWQNDIVNSSKLINQEYQFEFCRDYDGQFEQLIKDIQLWRSNNEKTVLISRHHRRLEELLLYQKIPIAQLDKNLLHVDNAHKVVVMSGSVNGGWSLSTKGIKLRLLTDKELTGYVNNKVPEKLSELQQQSFLSDLEIDDHVVHIDHGIGVFKGTIFLNESGSEKEYLELEYAAKDKLYVPTDQLDRVTKYVAPGNRTPSLTRLGTQEWHRSKVKATESTIKLAQHLLSIYASREIEEGIGFPKDTPWQSEMEDFFIHTETPDQIKSINEVKSDMEKPRPMDRLVCGDVGFGKTEVAIRAAFKAVMNGSQVAFLVPTTVLAQQHYDTLKKRFAPYPINLEVLSRFKNPKDQKQILSKISAGEIDICIGTHRLLQKDVAFKNLGLIVVDEEQRFGVSHKESLRTLGKKADLLTLTATPIPRTLHMALTGIKDMSTIVTPPHERLSIKTYVAGYDEELIKQAIYREMDRGGQIFYLHNKVQSINHRAKKLSELIPEAKITVAHGQMSEKDLSKAMVQFSQKETDILVCTTIIEAGLDIPNVNTLIIERADTFGLSQLYQLRGRIGRSSYQAYAYLLIPTSYQLSHIAEKRLQAILSATELGSGFRIAMRDLEIRGAGNLLGSEQSGHINAIGYELYTQILADTVRKLKADPTDYNITQSDTSYGVKITLPLPAFIPSTYINDTSTRLDVYQRLSKESSSHELDNLANELNDRFGNIPEELINLIYIVNIKILAENAGVISISQQNKNTVIHMRSPIEGAKIVLQRELEGLAEVGNLQIRIKNTKMWKYQLVEVIEKLSYFKKFIDTL